MRYRQLQRDIELSKARKTRSEKDIVKSDPYLLIICFRLQRMNKYYRRAGICWRALSAGQNRREFECTVECSGDSATIVQVFSRLLSALLCVSL